MDFLGRWWGFVVVFLAFLAAGSEAEREEKKGEDNDGTYEDSYDNPKSEAEN